MINIEYAIKLVPPLYGTDQLIITLSPLIAVFILLGTSGTRAAIIVA